MTLTGDYGSTASVQPLGPMHYTRAFCNSVVLPDGTVLIIGGQVALPALTCSSNGRLKMYLRNRALWTSEISHNAFHCSVTNLASILFTPVVFPGETRSHLRT